MYGGADLEISAAPPPNLSVPHLRFQKVLFAISLTALVGLYVYSCSVTWALLCVMYTTNQIMTCTRCNRRSRSLNPFSLLCACIKCGSFRQTTLPASLPAPIFFLLSTLPPVTWTIACCCVMTSNLARVSSLPYWDGDAVADGLFAGGGYAMLCWRLLTGYGRRHRKDRNQGSRLKRLKASMRGAGALLDEQVNPLGLQGQGGKKSGKGGEGQDDEEGDERKENKPSKCRACCASSTKAFSFRSLFHIVVCLVSLILSLSLTFDAVSEFSYNYKNSPGNFAKFTYVQQPMTSSTSSTSSSTSSSSSNDPDPSATLHAHYRCLGNLTSSLTVIEAGFMLPSQAASLVRSRMSADLFSSFGGGRVCILDPLGTGLSQSIPDPVPLNYRPSSKVVSAGFRIDAAAMAAVVRHELEANNATSRARSGALQVTVGGHSRGHATGCRLKLDHSDGEFGDLQVIGFDGTSCGVSVGAILSDGAMAAIVYVLAPITSLLRGFAKMAVAQGTLLQETIGADTDLGVEAGVSAVGDIFRGGFWRNSVYRARAWEDIELFDGPTWEQCDELNLNLDGRQDGEHYNILADSICVGDLQSGYECASHEGILVDSRFSTTAADIAADFVGREFSN